MRQEKHLIFGSGLIGSYLAGCFIDRGVAVSVVLRESAKTAFENGFQLSDFNGNFSNSSHSPNFVDPDHNTEFNVIWLSVKCTAMAKALSDLQHYVTSKTIIICCQNGFGSDDLVKEAFPENDVRCAVVGFNVAKTDSDEKQSHWRRSTEGSLIIENASQTLINQLESDLLPIKSSANINVERWAKLQLNLANAVNALADVPVKEMLESHGYRTIIAALMSELLLVTNKLEFKLPKVSAVPGKVIPMLMRLPNFIFKRIAQKMLAIDPVARTSMWHDLKNNQTTEIDFINGSVSAAAKTLNIKTPVNDALIKLIKKVENGEQSIGFSATQLKKQLNI